MKIQKIQIPRQKTFIHIMLWLLPAMWCWIISQFSLQNAELSAGVSSGFAVKIAELVCKTAEGIPGFTFKLSFSYIHHLVRKTAHFFIFAVLGFLLSIRSGSINCRKKTSAAAAVLLSGLCVAAVDEATQYFVPGRSAQLKDVIIDFSGACAGHNFFNLLLLMLNTETKYEKG